MDNNDWISVEKKLPTWDDGKVRIKLENGMEFDAIFNEMAWWWRIYTDEGIIQLEEEVTYWKYKK